VVFGPPLQGTGHYSGLFFYIIVLFLCVHMYCHYGTTLLQRLRVIGIFAILILFHLYIKNPGAVQPKAHEFQEGMTITKGAEAQEPGVLT
jgi:hypothetical protein